jgi:hypothetical protein
VRIFFVHHVTWSVNSVCHFLGSRRFDLDDRSTNVFWLALPSLGESWHHNHHAFPRSAVHGLKRWEVDPSGLIIATMEKIGLPGTWCASHPNGLFQAGEKLKRCLSSQVRVGQSGQCMSTVTMTMQHCGS